ncbi:MAG: ATP phosphoribosyltransferase regulatory subunit [Nitrospirae bacterium]|jgi:ATP phosphoribosyltransferase regulatory subunit|nr:ATP phosphoribosyltransferase regulatory subunit [Nitrospirota bacterium]
MKKSHQPASLPANGEKITRGHTPKGVGPVFSRIASFRRETISQLLQLFSLWGYTEITLPAFEYLDSLAPGLDPVLQHKAYTLQDRGSGHVLLLRPDATAQIARLVAQGQEKSPEVQKYAYSTTVFRHEDHHILERELLQTGIELFGISSAEADWEILTLCLEGVRLLDLDSPVLSLSHTDLQKSLIRHAGKDLPEEIQEGLLRSFYAHDAMIMTDLLRKAGKVDGPLIDGLEQMIGRTHSLPDAIRLLKTHPVFASSPDLVRGSSSLTFILELVSSFQSNIRVDFALNPGGPYYSGMVFHLYARGTSQELASGGRYDMLPALFGRPMPATGFAFHLNRIESLLGYRASENEKIVLEIQLAGTEKPVRDKLIECATELRKMGIPSSFRFEESPPENKKWAVPVLFWNGKDFTLSVPNGNETRFSRPDHSGIFSILQKR